MEIQDQPQEQSSAAVPSQEQVRGNRLGLAFVLEESGWR